jgi:peptide chain release factor 2
MLLRMYQRWGERHGFKVEMLDLQEAEQAGIRSAELAIEGEYAYGYLRSEIGVHRLVRISPFDANARRQTSFASVMVLPDVGDEDDFDIEIPDSDLRVDTFRSSGAGGQHVNKTESAVRLTHLPTGLAVACQQERSQHKNMATAMRLLKARLWDMEKQKRDAERVTPRGREEEDRVGQPDPLVRPPAVPAGQRPPHRAQELRRARHPRRRPRRVHRGLPPPAVAAHPD